MNILLITAVLAAYIVKGMCGFANTLVFSTILSFKENNIHISPVEVILGYPSNVILAVKNRKNIQWSMVLPLAMLVVLGSIPGVFFLKIGDAKIIKLFFGMVVIAIGVEMFYREKAAQTQQANPVWMAIIGLLSGVLCGLFGIGALLAAYVGRSTANNSAFKGNLCVVFLVDNTFRMVVYALTGILNLTILKQAIFLMPIMFLGLLLGMGMAKCLDEKKAKKVITIMLILSGISLVVTNL